MYKDLQAIRGKFHIHRLIEEGEHEHQDFKFRISDACKIARSISAFANNDGGRLLVGVKDNGVIAGIRSEEDVYVIEAAATVWCRPSVEVTMQAYRCEGGAVVLKASIPRAQSRPVECHDADGNWRAYYRVADENIVAHPLMVRAWRQARDSSAGGVTAYDSARAGAVLAAISRRGTATVEELMLDAHMSRRVAEDVIARMAVMGMVVFRYVHPEFKIAVSDGEA